MKLSDLRLMLTCHCRESSFLSSESLDRELTFAERWAVRLHHLSCGRCKRVAGHLRRLHQVLAEMPEAVRRAMWQRSCSLSPSARAKIVEALERSGPRE